MGRDMGPILAQRDKHKETIDRLREMRDVQGTDGNWNYDPYMQGLYNGTEFSLALLEDREPVYKEAPARWLSEMEGKRSVMPQAIETNE